MSKMTISFMNWFFAVYSVSNWTVRAQDTENILGDKGKLFLASADGHSNESLRSITKYSVPALFLLVYRSWKDIKRHSTFLSLGKSVCNTSLIESFLLVTC